MRDWRFDWILAGKKCHSACDMETLLHISRFLVHDYACALYKPTPAFLLGWALVSHVFDRLDALITATAWRQSTLSNLP